VGGRLSLVGGTRRLFLVGGRHRLDDMLEGDMLEGDMLEGDMTDEDVDVDVSVFSLALLYHHLERGLH